MKGRQSAAAAISVSQLLLVIAYLCVIGGIEIMFQEATRKTTGVKPGINGKLSTGEKKQEAVCRQATEGTVVLTSWSENSVSKENLLS